MTLPIVNEQMCRVLDRARTLLGPNGERWGKDHYYPDDVGDESDYEDRETERTVPIQPGAFCVAGSVRYATFILYPQFDPETVEDLFSKLLDLPPHISVTSINDAPETNFETVALLLEAARTKVCAAPADEDVLMTIYPDEVEAE